MKFLLDIIMDDGFELFQGKHLDYSSMRKDGLDSRYKKGDLVFIWGLNEFGKPPTLIHPRPKIISMVKDKVGYFEYLDDVMNECLKVFPHEEIYEGILKNWTFDLTTKTIIKT